jgi:SPP1 gp7 family putative phage head morphogenesis protein
MVKNNSDYWKKRTQEILSKADKSDMEFFYEIQDLFTQTSKEVANAIFSFYQKYGDNNGLTYEQAMQKLNEEEMADYVSNAKKYREQAKNTKDPELLKRLNAQYASSKVRRLEALKSEINSVTSSMGSKLSGALGAHLAEVSTSVWLTLSTESQVNLREIQTVVESEWLGSNYSKRVWSDTDKLVKRLVENLKGSFIRNETPMDLARKLRSEFNVTRSQAETLARTETTHVITKTTVDRYKDFGYEEYEYEAYLDSRTSQVCRNLDGSKFQLKDYESGVNAPPMHPNCRSTILPIIK